MYSVNQYSEEPFQFVGRIADGFEKPVRYTDSRELSLRNSRPAWLLFRPCSRIPAATREFNDPARPGLRHLPEIVFPQELRRSPRNTFPE